MKAEERPLTAVEIQMAFIKLPKLISDNFNSNELSELVSELGYDPENIFSPTATKGLKAQTLFRTATQRGKMLALLNAIHGKRPNLPLNAYLHLLMSENYTFSPDEIKNMYVERYADEQGRYYVTETEQQAQQVQEHYTTNNKADEFYDLVIGKAPHLQNYAFLKPSFTPAPIDIPEPSTSLTTPIETPAVTPVVTMEESDYVNFSININPTDDANEFLITAVSQNSQTQNISRQRLPDDPSFTNTLMMLQSLLVDEGSVTKLGEMLHDFLFPPEVTRLFTQVTAVNKKVRIRINIYAESVKLHQIPWEYCRYNMEFFGLDLKTPIVRFIPAFQQGATLQVPEKIRVLVALSSPADQSPIDINSEATSIQAALLPLGKNGKIDLRIREHITNDELIDEFMDFQPHIFHFVGHGGTKTDGEGLIWLEDDDGNSAELDAEDMMTLIKTSGGATKLVIFAACQSGAVGSGAENVVNGGFMGMGPRILKEVPAVIAMQYVVPQSTAFEFTRNVYTYMAKGEPLDKAVTRSRIRIYLRGKDKVFWGIPVLFMRSPDGKIW